MGATRDIVQVQQIFHHISSLDYADCPDYNLIQDHLVEIYNLYEMQVLPDILVQGGSNTIQKQYLAKRKPSTQVMDSRYLKMQLDVNREIDLHQYFKQSNLNPPPTQPQNPIAQLAKAPQMQMEPPQMMCMPQRAPSAFQAPELQAQPS